MGKHAPPGTPCVLPECDRPLRARGFCNSHYNRWKRYGDPRAGVVEIELCKHCGNPNPPKRARGPRPVYCTTECRRAAGALMVDREAAERRARLRRTAKLQSRDPRICPVCGHGFPATGRRIYCSKTCSRRAPRKSPAPICSKQSCEREVRAKGLCNTHYNSFYFPDGRTRWPAKPETRRRGLRIKSAKRRAVVAGAEAENVDREVVGERDRWVCGICGEVVRPHLRWPHRMSQSLDDVQPLSLGGQHTYANSRIAHLECNVRRSNKPDDATAALFIPL